MVLGRVGYHTCNCATEKSVVFIAARRLIFAAAPHHDTQATAAGVKKMPTHRQISTNSKITPYYWYRRINLTFWPCAAFYDIDHQTKGQQKVTVGRFFQYDPRFLVRVCLRA